MAFQILTSKTYVPNWHHRIIAEELEKIEKFGDRDFKVLLLFVPPRHGKSQQCTIDFPSWYLGKNPTKEIITASHTADLAQKFGGFTREKVDSESYRSIFSSVRLREDEKARNHWRTQQGGGYLAVGVGGPITGHGAHILLIDDPIKSREEAESEVYREKTWEWFISTAYTRLEPNAVIIVILQRWHTDDLAGRILSHLELRRRTKLINFPAIAIRDELPYRKVGEALWINRFPLSVLLETKEVEGPYNWAAQFQGNPVISENQEFKSEWIKRIQEINLYENVRRYLTIDTAISKKSYADSTGFCDNSVDGDNVWNIRAWRMKIGPEELIQTLFSLHESNKYETIGIEKTMYLDGLKPYLDTEQRRRNKFLPITELHHALRTKEVRIRGLIPRYAAGSIRHIEGACKDLEEEMFSFPFGVHDDVLDATAYQLQLADQPHKVNMQEISVFVPEL